MPLCSPSASMSISFPCNGGMEALRGFIIARARHTTQQRANARKYPSLHLHHHPMNFRIASTSLDGCPGSTPVSAQAVFQHIPVDILASPCGHIPNTRHTASSHCFRSPPAHPQRGVSFFRLSPKASHRTVCPPSPIRHNGFSTG